MGPYEVTRKTGKYNFKIMVDGVEKSYHANNLKVHIERPEEEVKMIRVIEDEDSEENPDQIKLQDRNDLILFESKNSSMNDVKYGKELSKSI